MYSSTPRELKDRKRLRDRLRWPTMLEIFTLWALFWGLWLGDIFTSWTLAILALAWSRFHNEEKEEES